MKTSLLILLLLPEICLAQTMDKLPENPEPGKCYVKCVTPDLYKNELVTVITKPESTKLTVVPAEYKTVTETIILKPASKKNYICTCKVVTTSFFFQIRFDGIFKAHVPFFSKLSFQSFLCKLVHFNIICNALCACVCTNAPTMII
jgi:hypothetical protein